MKTIFEFRKPRDNNSPSSSQNYKILSMNMVRSRGGTSGVNVVKVTNPVWERG